MVSIANVVKVKLLLTHAVAAAHILLAAAHCVEEGLKRHTTNFGPSFLRVFIKISGSALLTTKLYYVI